jgi:hypothetical protein
MKSERWLKLYRDGIVRENARVGMSLTALMKKINPEDGEATELSTEEQAELDTMQRGYAHNNNILAFIDFVLKEDDPAEITADNIAGEVLHTILTHRLEIIGFSEDAFKSIYQFRVPYGMTIETLSDILIRISNDYCAQYGVEAYDGGNGILNLVRYKSELRQNKPASITPAVPEELKEEVTSE